MHPSLTEQAALQQLLATGIFARSPNLERILVYLCERHFAGQTDGIKEYHIATEALGRSPDFDPRKDSIVRVEMLRLRRRLKEYYDSNPSAGPRIAIPEKTYVPEFVWNTTPKPESRPPEESSSSLAAVLPAVDAPTTEDAAPPAKLADPAKSTSIQWWLIAAAAVAVALAGASMLVNPFSNPGSPATSSTGPMPAASSAEASPGTVTPAATNQAPREEIRILAGRPPGRYIDQDGLSWEGDQFVTGGAARPVTVEVNTRGLDPNIFSGIREGIFQYDIPLKPGAYELLLLFAETSEQVKHPGGRPGRLFAVLANNQPLIQEYDALAEALDPSTATARRFRGVSPGPDGKLHLSFVKGSSGVPFVNAILIRQGAANRMNPIRIVTRTKGMFDDQNNFWESDHFFRGGFQIARPEAPAGSDGDRFLGERYGSFSYRIPVPPGRYTVKLHFREYWWGPDRPGKGGVGSRVFSVFANHRQLLTDFDILGASSPADPVVVRSFPGIEPDNFGHIVLDFVPRVNNALVNAIEVIDEQ